jgi:alcohol dehydrogenase (cytochrome c)
MPNVVEDREALLPEAKLRTASPKKRRRRLIGAAALFIVCASLAVVFAFKRLPTGWTWGKVTWRAALFSRKASGRIPELSWRELWWMTQVRGGFGLEGAFKGGYTIEGALTNPFVSSEDHEAGERIFRADCQTCHAQQGTGAYGPPLNRSGFSQGDSDLAVYKVVRDGIPGTGMAGIPMSQMKRWQLVGYLRTLQAANSKETTDLLPASHIQVSREQILQAGNRPDEWLTYSGSLNGHRYSPLKEITPKNVSQLRIRWIHQFETTESARTESTPTVVGGVIFITEPPANVVAVDAESGAVRWRYSRTLPEKLPVCCSRTNRGLAVLGNMVYFGSLDCYLIALDANTGSMIWQTQVCDPAHGFTMTGAPLIVNNSVVAGVAGGEYGIRGFLAAYDAKTGSQQWKFDTIPGPGDPGHETWKNDAWRTGGGPTWITGSYDPTLNLIYWGVGNPAPGLQGDFRSGDNLFTDSMLALHADSGKLAWYFQFTPHDEHDFDATQTPILADLPINGISHPVLCVANRNGFYYVLDRVTGKFLVGVPFVQENWATGVDSNGRPIPSADMQSSANGRATRPGVGGGTNWQNAAFDPRSGLIFVPATEGASVFTKSPHPERGELGFFPGSSGANYVVPEERVIRALDAATGTKRWERWERSLPFGKKSLAPGYSGLLATGGGLVFGAAGGFVFGIDSATGKEEWRVYLGGDTFAAPISVNVDGHQVILVSAGGALFMFGL